MFNPYETADENLIREYYERNKRKREDDRWLKENKPLILKTMCDLGKSKSDFGNMRVSVTIPDNSKFDDAKVLDFLLSHGLEKEATKLVVDEEALEQLVVDGKVDLEALKEAAWVEAQGTPRVSVKELVRNAD